MPQQDHSFHRPLNSTYSRSPIQLVSRRDALSRVALGLGSIALKSLLEGEKPLHAGNGLTSHQINSDLLVREPHFLPRAKRVVLLFQHGGPSQLDLFDPKPMLSKYEGKPVPGGVDAFFDTQDSGKCLPSPFRFSQHGECGMEFSELVPHLASCADDICKIQSMTTQFNDHESAIRMIQTGQARVGRPTLGSWITYALGAENQNLPAYVVLSDPKGDQVDGPRNWSSGWLPAIYQGTTLRSQGIPIFNLNLPEGMDRHTRRDQLIFLAALNEEHFNKHPHLSELEARIRNYELSANIKDSVTGALDLSQESEGTQRLYGLHEKETQSYGTRCLMARRLLEKGVRFVSIFNDLIMGDPWDTHDNHNNRTRTVAKNVDRPSAALIKDLKQRGLLEDTLIIWAGEFGRLPVAQGKDGRDHNRHGFTILLAGGGFKSGLTFGITDEFGYKVQENPVSTHQLHATILQALGLDHHRLTYPHGGREESLTDAVITEAEPVPEIIN